ncbi:DUF3857 domain-containing protein [Winogradskyella sp.]|uniref:DUF3857 domain-containing protein n=1 Tax=Winogradskyella sp. TaxID=1883156 RepID=UPI002637C7D1|nr:DUF3857 domain-containing protein [Winogradskyella sp.]
MKLNFVSILLIISAFCFGQSYNVDMQVLRPDLLLNTYKKDSTANALVIYDYGNSYIDRKTFKLVFQLKQKIKILKAEGIERGEFEVRLYKGKSSKESIKNIKGATYNLVDGDMERTKLTKSGIFEEDNKDYTLVKIVLPKVKVGSVITISYETESRFISKYQPWYFQGPDPVLYSEYNTSIPANYEYHTKLVGSIPLETNESWLEKNCLEVGGGGSADCSMSKYVMKNIPAYKAEAFTTTPLNYMSRIEYELSVVRGFDGSVDRITNTWEYTDQELKNDSDFGRQINKKSLVKKVLPAEISNIENPLDKTKAIYNYVLDNYRWDKKYGRFEVSVKDLLNNKVGNAFEINLLLLNLLFNENYEVYPILLSTRERGLATKLYPILTEFNYVIVSVNVNGTNYLLDATNPYLSFGELPYRCLNQYGRLIDFKDGSYWVDIDPKKYSVRQHRVQLNTFDETSISGELESNFSGYHSHLLKRRFDENVQDYKKIKAENYTNFEIDNLEVIDFDKKDFSLKEHINFTFEPEFIGNKIYLNPFLITFFEENPFKLQERTYPIDFGYRDSYLYVMSIDLGNNLKILEIPQSLNYALPDKAGSFVSNFEVKDNKLSLYFKVKFDKAIYESGYYAYLKTFMDKVVETQKNSIIVLEKQ